MAWVDELKFELKTSEAASNGECYMRSRATQPFQVLPSSVCLKAKARVAVPGGVLVVPLVAVRVGARDELAVGRRALAVP